MTHIAECNVPNCGDRVTLLPKSSELEHLHTCIHHGQDIDDQECVDFYNILHLQLGKEKPITISNPTWQYNTECGVLPKIKKRGALRNSHSFHRADRNALRLWDTHVIAGDAQTDSYT